VIESANILLDSCLYHPVWVYDKQHGLLLRVHFVVVLHTCASVVHATRHHSVHDVDFSLVMHTWYTRNRPLTGSCHAPHAARLPADMIMQAQGTIVSPPNPLLGCHLALASTDKLWAALRSFEQSWSAMGSIGRCLSRHPCMHRA